MIYYLKIQSLRGLVGERTPVLSKIYVPVGPFISLDHIVYSPTLFSLQLYLLPLGVSIILIVLLIVYLPLGLTILFLLTLYDPCLVSKRIPSLMPSRVVQIAISPPSSKIKNGGYICSSFAIAFIGVASATKGRTLKMLQIIRTKVMSFKVFIVTIINNLFNKNKYFLLFNKCIDGLSDLASGLLTKEPVISEIQNFEKYANSGVIFLLVEPEEEILGKKFGGKDIGNFYVESFEYTHSDFIYSNKSQKTVFKIMFKEYIS